MLGEVKAALAEANVALRFGVRVSTSARPGGGRVRGGPYSLPGRKGQLVALPRSRYPFSRNGGVTQRRRHMTTASTRAVFEQRIRGTQEYEGWTRGLARVVFGVEARTMGEVT